jgi:hypothetical protein
VVVYGFTVAATSSLGGFQDARDLEYWLNAPELAGARGPLLIDALMNWNYRGEDMHGEGTDQYGQPRPNPRMSSATYEQLRQKTEVLRQQRLSQWLAEHGDWKSKVPAADQAFYERRSAAWHAQHKSKGNGVGSVIELQPAATVAESLPMGPDPDPASLAWAEGQWLLERLRELRQMEINSQDEREKSAIAMLMVLLWESIQQTLKQWQAELYS